MTQISLTRIADNSPETLEASDAHVKNNEIIAFKANGQHYHLKPQGHSVDIMALAKAALAGGGAGAAIGHMADPSRTLEEGVGGALLGLLADFAFQEVQRHRETAAPGHKFVYVDERGLDTYYGPVSPL